jgi:ubiquinone/menaquinone biosynthesis C-methylase UbiE
MTVYKKTILSHKVNLYNQFLEQKGENTKILLVGVETGNSLCKCANIIINKNLKLFCINVDNVKKCNENIKKNNLEKHIFISNKTQCLDNETDFFDTAYVINCERKLDEIDEILSLVLDWLKNDKACYLSTILENINKEPKSKIANCYKKLVCKILKFNTEKQLSYETLSSKLLSIGAFIESFEYEYTMKKYGINLYNIFTITITNYKKYKEDK